MDWMLLVVLGIGLPSAGAVIGAMMLSGKYAQLKAGSHEHDMDETEFRRNTFGKYMIFQNMFATAPIFGLLIVTLLWYSPTASDAPEHTLINIGMACTLSVGISGFFVNITRGLILTKGLEALVKEPKNFGKALVHAAVPDNCLIFGHLIAILTLMWTGLLGGDFAVSLSQSREILNAVFIYSGFSSGILLSGVAIRKAKDPFVMPTFNKAITVSVLGVLPPLVGLLFVLYRFSEIGLF